MSSDMSNKDREMTTQASKLNDDGHRRNSIHSFIHGVVSVLTTTRIEEKRTKQKICYKVLLSVQMLTYILFSLFLFSSLTLSSFTFSSIAASVASQTTIFFNSTHLFLSLFFLYLFSGFNFSRKNIQIIQTRLLKVSPLRGDMIISVFVFLKQFKK